MAGVHSGQSIVTCAALLPLIAITACTQSDGTPAPEFLKAAEELAPFEIALPDFFPHGMELVDADVIVPPPGFEMAEDELDRNTQVVLQFANGDGSAEFVLYESIAGTSLGDNGVSVVDVDGVEGRSVEDLERGYLTIAWPGEEIGFLLTGYMTETLTRDEIMRIAGSIGE